MYYCKKEIFKQDLDDYAEREKQVEICAISKYILTMRNNIWIPKNILIDVFSFLDYFEQKKLSHVC
jgi:hypothetical protein